MQKMNENEMKMKMKLARLNIWKTEDISSLVPKEWWLLPTSLERHHHDSHSKKKMETENQNTNICI